MMPRAARKPAEKNSPGAAPAAQETLHLLSAVLRTAFRLHCTGETLNGCGPWQLIHAVQHKLGALAALEETMLSEEKLAQFLAAALPAPAALVPQLHIVG